MYYHELEKSRPGMWDKIYDGVQADKAAYQARGVQDNALDELVRRDFDKRLQLEMHHAYKAIEQTAQQRIHATEKIIQKNWARIQRHTEYQTPEEALHKINEQKDINLGDWMNELYDAENEPTFKYVVIQQLVKRYGKDKLMPPPEVDAEILAKVSEIIYTGNGMQEDGNVVQFWDLWQSATMAVQSSESFTGNGWIKYPQDSNPHKLKNAIQGSGWCIASLNYAEDYLSRGDIHIYFDGKARVSMHTDGGGGGNFRTQAREIFERFNRPVSAYASEVIEYAEANNIVIDRQTQGYEGLQTALEINSKLEYNEDYARGFPDEIRGDPGLFDYLKPEYKKVPEYRAAYAEAMLESLSAHRSRAIIAVIESVDNSILQEYEPQFFEAAKAAVMSFGTWFDLVDNILNPDKQNRVILKLAADPDVIAHVKQQYLVKKQEEQYHTTGQGQSDNSALLDKWLQEDPEFFEAAKDVLLARIGLVNTMEGSKVSPNESMFIQVENNSLVASSPEVIEAVRQKTLYYCKNNPDLARITKIEMDGYHARNNDIPLPVEEAEYAAIQGNVDNWLWLLSPNHPRQNGKHYHTIGMYNQHDLAEQWDTDLPDLSEHTEKQHIDLLSQQPSGSMKQMLLSHPMWPLNRPLGLMRALDQMPKELWTEPRIVDRIISLVVPVWQKSIDTIMEPPKEGQPYNPYSINNVDMMKMNFRYEEALTLDVMGLSSDPRIQQGIESFYRNPQFLYQVVRKVGGYLYSKAKTLEEAMKLISMPNLPIPNDPAIAEAVQTFRKEEAKKFLDKIPVADLSVHRRRTGDFSPGLDIMTLIEQQGMEMSKGQVRRESKRENFTSLSPDLQDDPEIQKFFDDRFRGDLEQSVSYPTGRTSLRSPFSVPRHLWEQEGFKEQEKEIWVRTLSSGRFESAALYQSNQRETWYSQAATAVWLSIPDHLKSDPDIQEAMEQAIKDILHPLTYAKSFDEIPNKIIAAYPKHQDAVSRGNWLMLPFNKLDTFAMDRFVSSAEIMHDTREKLIQVGYNSEFLAWIDKLNSQAVAIWREIRPEVERSSNEKRQNTTGMPASNPAIGGGMNPGYATSWLDRIVEAAAVRRMTEVLDESDHLRGPDLLCYKISTDPSDSIVEI